MKGFTFKISPENQDKVYREILLPGNITFEDFHYALLDSFEVNPGEMASFFLSDKNWTKKQEITLMDMMEEGAPSTLMSDVQIDSIVSSKQTHFYYVYDFLFCKNFHVELIDTIEEKEINPLLISAEGDYESMSDDDLTKMLLEEFDPETKNANKNKNSQSKGRDTVSELDNFEEFNNFMDDDDYNDDEPQFDNIDDYDL